LRLRLRLRLGSVLLIPGIYPRRLTGEGLRGVRAATLGRIAGTLPEAGPGGVRTLSIEALPVEALRLST
jgi:hypothetical protein